MLKGEIFQSHEFLSWLTVYLYITTGYTHIKAFPSQLWKLQQDYNKCSKGHFTVELIS